MLRLFVGLIWLLALFPTAFSAVSLQDDANKFEQANENEPAEVPSAAARLTWPVHRDNNSTSCATLTSCTSCADASWCHWCDKTQACHVMGSVYGCWSGSNCNVPPPSPPSNDSCAAHANCTECALASHLCHWCAHDNACHSVGSIYGCVTGVDCYSNSRCQRKRSEPIHRVVFTEMGLAPAVGLITLATMCVCCSTLCFCVARGVKGAYDDLVSVAGGEYLDEDDDDEPHTQPLVDAPQHHEETVVVDEEQVPATAEENHAEEYIRLVEGSEHDESSPRRPRRPTHMQHLYNACVTTYMVFLLILGTMVLGFIRYYPKMPEYNICNDAMAWNSIIDSLTHLKAIADFEILASVSNPNHVDVVLDMGKGSFTHDGAFVGTFDIPPTNVQAMSITDLLIVAHLSPDKWDALALTTAYYQGNLVLYVDAEATIRVPALADLQYSGSLKNIVVHVNELSDRHLCACQNWADAKNHSKQAAGKPHWVLDTTTTTSL